MQIYEEKQTKIKYHCPYQCLASYFNDCNNNNKFMTLASAVLGKIRIKTFLIIVNEFHSQQY